MNQMWNQVLNELMNSLEWTTTLLQPFCGSGFCPG